MLKPGDDEIRSRKKKKKNSVADNGQIYKGLIFPISKDILIVSENENKINK